MLFTPWPNLLFSSFYQSPLFSFSWRKIALQCCIGFSIQHTTTQISHNFTYIPSLLSLPPLHHLIPLDHHRLPSWAPFPPAIVSHMVVYIQGFPGQESACNAGDPSSTSGSGRSAGEGIGYPLQFSWASLVAQLVKNPSACHMGDLALKEGMGTHSSILA